MPEANLLDEVIHQDELSCLSSMEALQDVCSEVLIMVRLRQKHHCRIHRGGILAATESPMAPEVASCDEAVAINAHLHVAGMSFCRGSVNCHGSDGQMYHFCESSRSGEIFLDQYRGGGGGSLFPVINSSESAYSVASES